MGHEMFADSSTRSNRHGRQAWYTVPFSILAHALVLAALVAVPLLATDALPTPQSVIAFVVPPPPPVPPRLPSPPPPQPLRTIETSINSDAAPVSAPEGLTAEPLRTLGAHVVGAPSAVPGPLASFAAPPAPVSPVAPDVPIRPGGEIREPRKIHDVKPIYPPIAIAAKVDGVVIVEATIAKDGTVKDARILRSRAMLDEAALESVRQWRYTPTLLNGMPVEVLMTVTVQFSLR